MKRVMGRFNCLNMNILKLNVVIFSSLIFLLLTVVSCSSIDDYADGKLGKSLILGGNSHTVKIPHYGMSGILEWKVKTLNL